MINFPMRSAKYAHSSLAGKFPIDGLSLSSGIGFTSKSGIGMGGVSGWIGIGGSTSSPGDSTPGIGTGLTPGWIGTGSTSIPGVSIPGLVQV
jgi:hypothetical protein